MKFLGNLFTVILGCLIAAGIFFVMFIFFIALVGSSEDTVTVKKDSVLRLSINKELVEYDGKNGEDPLDALFQEKVGLNKILKALEKAKTDDRIKGISIENNFITGGMAQTKAMRDAITDFKSSGKFVYAYSDVYTQSNYYLASVADSIFINPVGGLDFRGLASEILYYKQLQEKTGIKMEVIRHGKYKSAVEPYLSNEMSDANREQISELLHDLWRSIKNDISGSRNITVDQLDAIADSLAARTPKLALQNGLVDKIAFFDQYNTSLKQATNNEDGNIIHLNKYIKAVAKTGNKPGAKKIAVIYAEGMIIYGKGDARVIGQTTMVEAIEKAVKNKSVEGIVLRVNSPGGSALSSDIIWRAIEKAKEEKPVVVSMGNLAASGGYYIATGAEKIFAEPHTITGSIGVFGTLPNASEFAKNIGVNAEQVVTNSQALSYSIFEPMSQTTRNTIKEGIEAVYDVFLERVAAGRGMTKEAVNQVAQGRVWSGLQAKDKGLVDEIGGLDDAIAYLSESLEMDNPGIVEYPKFKSGLEAIMEDFGASVYAKYTQDQLQQNLGTEFYDLYRNWKAIRTQKGVQAMMPYQLTIK